MVKQWTGRPFPLVLALVMFVTGAALWAQDRVERGERDQRDQQVDRERGPRGRQIDPEQMRERAEQRRAAMAERMREQLDVSNEEWAVLEPMIQRVQTLQMQSGQGMGMGSMMRGGRGFGDGPRARGRGSRNGAMQGLEARDLPPVPRATRELQQTLADENANEAQINERLQALREARAEHQQQLDEAREELRSVLTPRQEAQLVIMGLLD